MAGEAADEDDDLFEAPEGDEGQDDQDQDQTGGDSEGDEEETVIGFGEDEPGEQDEAGLVPHLRAELRERNKRIRELEQGQSRPQPIEVGDEPTIEDCEYDQTKFLEAHKAWEARKAEAEKADAQPNQDAQAVQAAFQEDLGRFATQRASLKVKDFEDAESEVVNALSREQNAVLVMAADNSAALIYALGKHPDRLKALAAIKNPIKLAAAVSKLERDLKVTKRRAPEPEGTVRGSAPLSTGKGDKHEERLEKEARGTGDRSKLIAYRKQKAQGSR
jgi:hypothetical protein